MIYVLSVMVAQRSLTKKEPYIGNSISGCDDIGEPLTGNTEGME